MCDRVAIMVSGQLRLARPDSGLFFRRREPPSQAYVPLFSHQVYRHHPAFEREIRSMLQLGGETARGAVGPAAGGAAAQRDPPNLSSSFAAGEVRLSRAGLFVGSLLRF